MTSTPLESLRAATGHGSESRQRITGEAGEEQEEQEGQKRSRGQRKSLPADLGIVEIGVVGGVSVAIVQHHRRVSKESFIWFYWHLHLQCV